MLMQTLFKQVHIFTHIGEKADMESAQPQELYIMMDIIHQMEAINP